MSINRSIAIMVMIFVVLPMLVMTAFNHLRMRTQLTTTAYDSLVAEVHSASAALEDTIARYHDTTALIASRTRLRRLMALEEKAVSAQRRREIGLILEDAVASVSEVQSASVFRVDGVGVARIDTPHVSGWRDWERLDLTEGPQARAGIAALMRDTQGHIWAEIHAPLVLEGAPVGTLVVLMDASAMERIALTSKGLGDTGEMIVGIMEYRPDPIGVFILPSVLRPNAALRERVPIDRVRPALSADPSRKVGLPPPFTDVRGKETLLYGNTSPTLGWIIAAKKDYDEVLQGLWLQSASFGVVAILSGFVLGFLLYTQLTQRVASLFREIVDEAAGAGLELGDDAAGDELGRLSGAVTSLMEALTAANRTLEDRVEARTQALRNANDELSAAQERLAQASKLEALGEMATSIVHEINQPLTQIRLIAEDVLEELPEGTDAFIREEVADILVMADRIGTMSTNLRGFARTSSGQAMERITPLELMTGALPLIMPRINASGVELKVDAPDDLPEFECNVSEIQQIFINIVLNALDAMEGMKDKKLAVRLWETGDGKTMQGSITDNGPGIPPEKLEHIFESFYTTKDRTKGTGLGLAISRRIAEAHGGKLWVERTELGKGTTFQIKLPISQKSSTNKAARSWGMPGIS